MSLFAELKRRNVIRVGVAYLVAAWLLIEASSLILDIYNAPEWIIQVIVALIAVGLPVAIFFAWAFEITPEGIKREHEVDRSTSITQVTARRLDIVTIILVVGAVGLLAVDRFIMPAPTGPGTAARITDDGRASVAVLPFVNMSGNAENEYFSDGLTETLLHMLAQVDELRVPARTSSFAFKGTNVDIREIAAKLDVTTILEGSVQRAGQRVRVTAQLVDATDGSHIWSQNYDRNLDDIFAIQDEIANAVAAALTESLLGEAASAETAAAPRIETVSTRSTEAYDHYLRGLGPLATNAHSSLPDAETAFKEALLVDPSFREARLALVKTYIAMGDTALMDPPEAYRKAETVLAPLIEDGERDPVATAYAIFIESNIIRQTRFLTDEEESRAFERIAASIARAPNEPDLYLMAAESLRPNRGNGEEALGFIDRGLVIDPLSPDLWFNRGTFLANVLERYDEALEAYERARALEPDNPNPIAFTALVHGQRGEYAAMVKAFAVATSMDRQDHELPAFAASVLMDMGLHDEATHWLERARLLNAEGGATQAAELQYLYETGRRDEALAMAEHILRARSDNRRDRLGLAADIYGTEMLERGRFDEALELFEELAPGSTTDPTYWPTDIIGLQVQQVVLRTTWPEMDESERSAWREATAAGLDRVRPDWRDDPRFALFRYHMGLQPLDEAAADEAEHLSEHRPDFADTFVWRSPMYEPFASHPDVQQARSDYEGRIAEQAAAYLRMVEAGEIPGV